MYFLEVEAACRVTGIIGIVVIDPTQSVVSNVSLAFKEAIVVIQSVIPAFAIFELA